MATPTGSSRSARGPRLDQVAGRGGQGGIPMGTLTRKIGRHSSPNRSASISSPADQRAGDGGQPDGGPEHPGARPLLGREGDLDDREDLGEHDRPNRPWSTRADQHVRVWASPQRAEASVNPAMPDHEQALAPEDVAQAPAGDQHDREGQLVAGQHPLDL